MAGDRIDNYMVPVNAVGMSTLRVRSAAFGIQEARSDAERPDVEVSRVDDVPPAVRRL
jgi:FMN phosphatase YigB (HAD superfamily)